MSHQRFFGGKFNGSDFAQTQQASRDPRYDADAEDLGLSPRADVPRALEHLLVKSHVQIVMNLRGSWDVLVFGPMRKIAEGVSRAEAERIADAERRRT